MLSTENFNSMLPFGDFTLPADIVKETSNKQKNTILFILLQFFINDNFDN